MNYSLERLAAEQEDLLIGRFDYDFTWMLGQNIRERASRMKAPVAIEVSHGSTPVFVALLPGATSDNLDWTARKRAVVLRFHRSSLAVRFEAEKGGYDFNERFRLPKKAFVASGGGVPLILRNGTIIGTAAVSGLPEIDDHTLVVDALREALNAETGNR